MKANTQYVYEPFMRNSDRKRGVIDHCEICSVKFGIFTREHVCKRCYRSVCDECGNNKVMLWKDNFTKGNHRMCKTCKVESDRIKSYIKFEGLAFNSDSKSAFAWKKLVHQPQEKSRRNKNNVSFTQDQLLQLWNSLTYSMKDFIGGVLGENVKDKIPQIHKQVKKVIELLHQNTQIRIQTVPYIVILLLCYCNTTTAFEVSLHIVNTMRVCQTQRQLVNDCLKDLGCQQPQIKSLEDYIDQRMRKFVSVIGMNVLEASLVWDVLNESIQFPEAVLLYYGSLIASQKKACFDNLKDKDSIDLALLRSGNPIEIKRNFNRLKSRFLKNNQKKAQKRSNKQIQSQQKAREKNIRCSDLNLKTNIDANVQISKSKSLLYYQPNLQTQDILQSQQFSRMISSGEKALEREYGDQWKITKKRKKNQKTGSYMDLAKDFQIKLRQMRSLGLQTVVSSKKIRRVHRIDEDFQLTSQAQKELQQANSQLNYLKFSKGGQSSNDIVTVEDYQKLSSFSKQLTVGKSNQQTNISYESKPSTEIDSSINQHHQIILDGQKQSQTQNKVFQELNSNIQYAQKSFKQPQEVEVQNTQYKQQIASLKNQLHSSNKKIQQLSYQTTHLQQKVKYYQRILPQKEALILQYKTKQNETNLKNQTDNLQSSKYKLEVKSLQQKIIKLELENRKLEQEKSKLQTQSILNRSSIPSNHDAYLQPQNDLSISMLSTRSLIKETEAPKQQVIQLKRQLELMTFTLKQKNQFLQTLTIENKKLSLEFQKQKRQEDTKSILMKEQYQNKIADLELQKTRSRYQNQRLMKKLQQMTLKILMLQSQLIQQNRKQFDYQD